MTLSLTRVRLILLEAPVDTPVRTSFAVMTHRPALLAMVEDRDGAVGWGEIWCNHPPVTGRARMMLAEQVVAPRLLAGAFERPEDVFGTLTSAFRTLAVQTAEPGPYAQVIAGLEAAVWDLAARRAGVPLYRLLGGGEVSAVPAYASGINPGDAVATIERARSTGHRRFKVKVGFDEAEDIDVVSAAASVLQPGERFMLDANQGWSLDQAKRMLPKIAEFDPKWIEEPIHADEPISSWTGLSQVGGPPIAGGENLLGDEFDAAIACGAYTFIQPDVAKWGGINGCLGVARKALAADRVYCPHFLGAAPGLLASAHILAAAGGDGVLEVDVNDNPLRTDLNTQPMLCVDGAFSMSNAPGIGFSPADPVLRAYQVSEAEITLDS